jgi:membrane protein YqaA with SNARE-associated domain
MTSFITNFGYLGLMVFCFLAATVFPVASEAALVAALALKMPAIPSLVFATIGNCAGIVFNYSCYHGFFKCVVVIIFNPTIY